jgi:uncharacterized protein YebE (UPF0316 family)
MPAMPWLDHDLFAAVGVPALIFLGRLTDVTLGTLRILLVARGLRRVAPLVGFVEVLVWLVVLTTVVEQLDRPLNFIAYAAGFAAGTYAGMFVEGKIALGLVSVRVITDDDASELLERLRDARFGVTDFAARGLQGRVRFILTILPRRDLPRLEEIVRRHHPQAFVSVSDVRAASEGFGVVRPRRPLGRMLHLLRK